MNIYEYIPTIINHFILAALHWVEGITIIDEIDVEHSFKSLSNNNFEVSFIRAAKYILLARSVL